MYIPHEETLCIELPSNEFEINVLAVQIDINEIPNL